MKDRHEARDDEISALLNPLDVTIMKTSAKSGENVERAFVELAKTIVVAPA